jgi:hypothetical protein
MRTLGAYTAFTELIKHCCVTQPQSGRVQSNAPTAGSQSPYTNYVAITSTHRHSFLRGTSSTTLSHNDN